MTDTANAPERKVFDEWFQDTFKDPDGSLEHLPKWFLEDAWFIWKASATHCDELVAAARAEGAREAQAKIARLTEALTPSGDTKAAYMSEFEFIVFGMNDDGEECSHKITVPWTAIKEIMAAIKARAALQENADE